MPSTVRTNQNMITVGDSFALICDDLILVVLNLGTIGADVVMMWLDTKSPFTLLDDTVMGDGRFVGLLARQ